jgi:hypothetical protein
MKIHSGDKILNDWASLKRASQDSGEDDDAGFSRFLSLLLPKRRQQKEDEAAPHEAHYERHGDPGRCLHLHPHC